MSKHGILSSCKGLWTEVSRTACLVDKPDNVTLSPQYSLKQWKGVAFPLLSTVLGGRSRKEDSLGLQVAPEKSVSLTTHLLLWPQETCLQANGSLRSSHKHKENV